MKLRMTVDASEVIERKGKQVVVKFTDTARGNYVILTCDPKLFTGLAAKRKK